ncbi:hypothetical protein BRADI_4g22540v3 [Brachypodium distachyon]|uniref:GRF-type domain-containing protein n=1 Tax=Brachypodium distachyon TaxID=15368 RepID=I1IML4_BRADI|nr:hypothetical protein BRADI_4g22540v3 [Brachypodium distachyon]
MSSSSRSMTNRLEPLPLTVCPFCGRAEVEVLTSTQPGTRGQRFYKCPFHTGMRNGCSFLKPERTYAKLLPRDDCMLRQNGVPPAGGPNGDLPNYDGNHFQRDDRSYTDARLCTIEQKIDNLFVLGCLIIVVVAISMFCK